jgi:hypothetical protein
MGEILAFKHLSKEIAEDFTADQPIIWNNARELRT